MAEAESLRRQAERALRLARGISDEQAAQVLRAHAAYLHARAEWLERQEKLPPSQLTTGQQQPAQQQRQIQPIKKHE